MAKEPEAEELSKLPEEWKKHPLHDMVEEGWRPRVKKVKGTEYLCLRLGNKERSLGHYTPETWNLLLELFPKLKAPKVRKEKPGSLLRTKIVKPLASNIRITLRILDWYSWAQESGYEGTLGEFLDEIVGSYFYEHKGLGRPVVRYM